MQARQMVRPFPKEKKSVSVTKSRLRSLNNVLFRIFYFGDSGWLRTGGDFDPVPRTIEVVLRFWVQSRIRQRGSTQMRQCLKPEKFVEIKETRSEWWWRIGKWHFSPEWGEVPLLWGGSDSLTVTLVWFCFSTSPLFLGTFVSPPRAY